VLVANDASVFPIDGIIIVIISFGVIQDFVVSYYIFNVASVEFDFEFQWAGSFNRSASCLSSASTILSRFI